MWRELLVAAALAVKRGPTLFTCLSKPFPLLRADAGANSSHRPSTYLTDWFARRKKDHGANPLACRWLGHGRKMETEAADSSRLPIRMKLMVLGLNIRTRRTGDHMKSHGEVLGAAGVAEEGKRGTSGARVALNDTKTAETTTQKIKGRLRGRPQLGLRLPGRDAW